MPNLIRINGQGLPDFMIHSIYKNNDDGVSCVGWSLFIIFLAHLLRHTVLKMAKWHNTNKDNNRFFRQIKSVVITGCGMCSLEP